MRCGCCRIEKSWRLWQKFNDQQQKLDDWLDEAEQKLQAVTSEEATFDTIKNEIRNVEVRHVTAAPL